MKLILNTLFALAAVTALAQVPEERIASPVALPCPHPTSITLHGQNAAPAPDPADFPPAVVPLVAGSQWNQTAINKQFGHTFHFPAPGKECCLMTSGKLTVRVKALQGGGPKTSTSANDGFTLFSHGVAISSQAPWNTTGVATGAIATLTFIIPPNVLAQGMVSIYGEDDSAFVSADLTLQGCCLK